MGWGLGSGQPSRRCRLPSSGLDESSSQRWQQREQSAITVDSASSERKINTRLRLGEMLLPDRLDGFRSHEGDVPVRTDG